MNWHEAPIDLTAFPNNKGEFTNRVIAETDVSRHGATSLWEFRNEIKNGDEVLVYSTYNILGQGQVTGDYYYANGAEKFLHRRPAVWRSVDPVSTAHVSGELQSKLSRQQTLIELSPEEFAEATGRDIDEGEALVDLSAIPQVLKSNFSAAGLTYTSTQIAAFYTAMQTKGFVILSGISGTGKSKIAQRFADFLPSPTLTPTQLTHSTESAIRLGMKPYMQKYNRFIIPKKYRSEIPLPDVGESWNVSALVDGVVGEALVSTRDDASVVNFVFLKGKAAEAFRKLPGGAFAAEFEPSDNGQIATVIVNSLSANPQSASSTSLVTSSASQRNHLFLPVRPDWRDGKALIGYHNPLSGEYVRTEFLEFVIAAGDDYRAGKRNAFFVILDEMNLAHVEYYFADVLSVIESGRNENGWTVEGIPLNVGEEDADLPERLHLPPNLYIVGTVNMDETTHPFSPKVLDRAFTIELTEVDFIGYPTEASRDLEIGDEEKQALLQAFTQNGRYPRIDKGDIRSVVERHDRFRIDLQNLNTSLRRSRMHFGYRVFDEIMQFVHNAEQNGLLTPDDAFDHAVLMKVLPKFNGSRGKLERALVELILWSRQSVQPTESEAREVVDAFENYLGSSMAFETLVKDSDDWRYPATGERAAIMMQDLYTEGFASFG